MDFKQFFMLTKLDVTDINWLKSKTSEKSKLKVAVSEAWQLIYRVVKYPVYVNGKEFCQGEFSPIKSLEIAADNTLIITGKRLRL